MDDPVPKVSIIIPAYNHAPWITQALESVANQTFQDWELIIIDDASTDQTWEVVQQYLNADGGLASSRCTTLQHSQNQGAPATLNEGLSMAQGEYIAVLNSDDVWSENRLSILYNHTQQTGCDFVATAVRLWDKDSRLKNASEPHWLEWYSKLKRDWDKNSDFLHTLLLGNFLITTSNFFFRRTFYERLGGFAELRYVHDYEYALRLWQGGARMACLWDESLLNYRLHGDNTIREQPLAAIQENMTMLLNQLPALCRHFNASRLHALRWQLGEIFRYHGEEWQTEVHLSLVAKEKEFFGLIEDRDQWVAERDKVIAEQNQDIRERDQWVAERDDWIVERDGLIQHLQQDIGQQQCWIQERESWLSDRDEMISKRDQWVAERDGWIAERDELISQLQQDQDRLLNSRAFRLGELILNPLRAFRGWLRVRGWSHGHA
ncbi:MAG: glycosyltransferase family 2 protein [Thiolinea sp.]